MEFITNKLKAALSDKEHHSSGGFSAEELVESLGQMAVNDSNKKKVSTCDTLLSTICIVMICYSSLFLITDGRARCVASVSGHDWWRQGGGTVASLPDIVEFII